MSDLDPPILVELEPPVQEEYGLSADTMLGWLLEMVNIPKWRPQCDEDHDFYEANQLKREVVDAMKARGQAAAPIPYCSAAIDVILGMEVQTRTGVKVDTAPGEVTPDVADALSVKLFDAVAETGTDAVVAEAYHGQVVGGIDWVEVGRNEDPFKPSKRVTYVPYHEMWFDWRAKDVILRDARYIVRKKRYDFDVIVARWPEIAPVITSLGRGNRYQTWDYPQFGAVLNRGSEVDRGLREEEYEWFNTVRKTALVYEVWYKRLEPVQVFYRADGQAIKFDPGNQYHTEALARGLINVEDAYTQRVRVAFWVGNIRVSDEPTPYPHNEFPYVPFFAFREKRYGSPYGLMRRMRGIQELINNTSSKIHFYLGSNQCFYDERAFEDPNIVKKELNKPNFFIPVKANPSTGELYKVELHRGSQLLEPHINYLNALVRMFHDVSGVHPASLGSQSGEMAASAVAIARSQDSTGLGRLNDNYRQSRRIVHELLLYLVIEELKGKTNIPVEVARDIGGPKTVIINQVMEDGSVQNSVGDINVRVVLENVPKSETYNQQVLTGLSEFLKSAPPDVQALMMPGFLRLSNLPGHDRIADLLAENIGLTDSDGKPQDPRIKQLLEQVQALQQQLEAKRPQALVDAEVDKVKAQTQQIMASVKETVAKTVETTIRSFFEAANTGAVIAGNAAISPVADTILAEAGFQRSTPPGEAPGIPSIAPVAPVQFAGGNKHPNTPPAPPTPGVPLLPSPTAQRPPRKEETPGAGVGKNIEGGQNASLD